MHQHKFHYGPTLEYYCIFINICLKSHLLLQLAGNPNPNLGIQNNHTYGIISLRENFFVGGGLGGMEFQNMKTSWKLLQK